VPAAEVEFLTTASPSEDPANSEWRSDPLPARVRARAKALERTVFRALCRLLLVRIDKEESEHGVCATHPSALLLPDFSKLNGECQVLLEQAIRYFEAAEKRHETMKDKGKTILALLVFVASFIALSANFFDFSKFFRSWHSAARSHRFRIRHGVVIPRDVSTELVGCSQDGPSPSRMPAMASDVQGSPRNMFELLGLEIDERTTSLPCSRLHDVRSRWRWYPWSR
jgi:hypothetical protein